MYRNLNYTNEDLAIIWEAAASVLGDSMLELPGTDEIAEVYARELYSIDMTEAYETYREELKKLAPEEWIRILSDPESYDQEVIQFYIIKNGIYTVGSLPVTKDFPKTGKLLEQTRIQSETEPGS